MQDSAVALPKSVILVYIHILKTAYKRVGAGIVVTEVKHIFKSKEVYWAKNYVSLCPIGESYIVKFFMCIPFCFLNPFLCTVVFMSSVSLARVVY